MSLSPSASLGIPNTEKEDEEPLNALKLVMNPLVGTNLGEYLSNCINNFPPVCSINSRERTEPESTMTAASLSVSI